MATKQQIRGAAARRVRFLLYIRTSIEQQQRPPTPAELADTDAEGGHPRVSVRQVQNDLRAMATAGIIELDTDVVRGIRLPGVRVILEPVPA